MKPAKPLDLTRTAAALEAFDAIGDALDAAKDGDTVRDALVKLEAARSDLAHAFADDTADRNDRLTVLGFVMSLAGMTFVRRMVATWGPKASTSLRAAERAGKVA